jgi:hypothetical protein
MLCSFCLGKIANFTPFWNPSLIFHPKVQFVA